MRFSNPALFSSDWQALTHAHKKKLAEFSFTLSHPFLILPLTFKQAANFSLLLGNS